MELIKETSKSFEELIQDFKQEFAEKGSFIGIKFDYTYIVMLEKLDLTNKMKIILPIMHSFKTKEQLITFTKKLIDNKPANCLLKYLVSYEVLEDDTFKGFFFSVKNYSTNTLESKLYYTDNGRIVYETDTTESKLVW